MGGYFQSLKVVLEVKMILWAYISMIYHGNISPQNLQSNYLNNMYINLLRFQQ